MWREAHVYALLDVGPRRANRKGKVERGAKLEKIGSRLNAFYDLRRKLSLGLAYASIGADEARAEIAASTFASEMHVAESREAAAIPFAELRVEGNNAWSDGGFESVLWITMWPD